MLSLPNGLVVSSDDQVRQKLAEILGHGGLAPVAPIGRREMQSPDPSRNIPNALAREFISIGSCLPVLIVTARWFDITT
jgi:hypothetical protein